MEIMPIGTLQLLYCLVFVFLAGISSMMLHLGLQHDIFWGTVRTFAQLFLMGYVLRYIFMIESGLPVVLIYSGMIFFAAWTIRDRVKRRGVGYFLPTLVSMLISYLVVAYAVTALIVQVDPWYEPRYFIPLGGMVIGNSMNSIAIALDRLFSDFESKRDEVEMYLALGADYREASQEAVRGAVRAGMIPSINAMMGVGIVFIPGMMTGQIIAGADPLTSIKYQIVVMLMLVASTALGSILVVLIVRRLAFTPAHQLKSGLHERH